ncbi:Uncharacterized protein TPAR_06542 [Tolypocladium paradoxum]|uniref:Methyltransferase domain-containing protein n=1 Tax=Tolypocladium paradoxum TaxID=94208 RepID=A0A2S4KSS6_9HYPO|nr:Uncharacterized protein TPAR_06542 [Tolypocladium paradoxum]
MSSTSEIKGTLDSWEANADFWDEKMGADGNEYWSLLQKPYLHKLIDVQPGCRVLDLATGNGMASRFLAGRGASVVATDGSVRMLKNCRERCTPEEAERMSYAQLDVTKPADFDDFLKSPLAEGGFDVVVINMAIMDVETLDPLADALPKLLKTSGIFVATMLHPVFFTSGATRVVEVVTDPTTGEYYDVRGKVIRSYMKVAPWRGVFVNGQPAHQLYFHRPLHELFGVFFKRELVMDALEEPSFTEEDAEVRQVQRAESHRNYTQIPPIMAFRMRKIN